jgi:hypothetical protein
MALSDEERARLEKLEQELAATDPDLYRKLQTGMPGSRASSHTVYGVLTALSGLGLVITGIITKLTVIGAIGFLLMIAGAYWYLYGLPRPNRPGKPPA